MLGKLLLMSEIGRATSDNSIDAVSRMLEVDGKVIMGALIVVSSANLGRGHSGEPIKVREGQVVEMANHIAGVARGNEIEIANAKAALPAVPAIVPIRESSR